MHKKYLLSTSALIFAAFAGFVSFNVYAEGKNGVAARVNGEEITIEEIKKSYEANPQIAAQVPFDQFYPKALEIFVNGKLVYQAAQKANIEKTPEYKEQLETAKQDLARKIYMEKAVAEKVTPEAVQDVYDNTYLKNFESQKEAKAKHILVADEATAKEIIKKLNNKEDFDKLAKEYSKDQADLGYFTEKMMVPEFSKAAFAMKKGEISQKPVKTQFGYHVILLEDIRDSKPLPLKVIEPQIRQVLTQKAVAETFDSLSANGKLEMYALDGTEILIEKTEK